MNSSRRVRSRDLDMNDVPQFVQRLLSRLHAYLPLAAYPRPILLASLRGAIPDASAAPCCIVTNVFYAGDEHGIMCQLEAPSAKHPSPTLVAPIAHIAFDRRHPISHEITAYRKRRLEALRGAGIGSTASRNMR